MLFRTLLTEAARRAARDPRLRQAAMDALQKATPHVKRAAAHVVEAARAAPPHKDPKAFARTVRERVFPKG